MNEPHLRLSPDRPTSLKNETCPYCGKNLSRRSSTKEHVVGRRFVPQGTMSGCWNLILRACRTCNQLKSDLEDDLSAITMAFHTFGLTGLTDDLLTRDAMRKGGRSFSRTTGKPVSQSKTTLNFSGKAGAMHITGNFVAPAQLDEERVFELARLQLTGFFYFLTYDLTANRGNWWSGSFMPLLGTARSDWGNPINLHFMRTVEKWDYRLIVTTADGYFHATIRRHPTEDLWAWAVEWNRSYRVLGFFGGERAAVEIASTFPQLYAEAVYESGSEWVRMRIETPLAEAVDTLFANPGVAR
ncbi:HNH endonuclease [Massilia arenosa]|uniref:HNH endonuclease n=1 Tax=Zemynaea arenosa TaxID=2561931 RepID=A0A4Y9S0A9_9BURK|nr:HNH endonuclease signature motif containing protein [Massilia arenosa]TFW13369.1 HNH endonuclease [Massilia arenosa]